MSFYVMLVAGFALLLVGGDVVVRGAVATAERLGLSSLFIGVVLVGFGTSMPELVTSVEASLLGSPGIAIGNIVGSNISNILLVLGLSALIAPIAINAQAVNRDGLFVLGSTLLFVAIGYFASLERGAGLGLLAGLAIYIYAAYRQEGQANFAQNTRGFDQLDGPADIHSAASQGGTATLLRQKSLALPLVMTVTGVLTLIIGGKLLVDGARGIAMEAGVSETIIGLTVVAIGTSLPEMITCIIAALRRHGDVALGNILGSCVYNLLAIAGVTAIISPTMIPAEIATFDNLVMLGATLVMLLFLKSGSQIGRLQGGLLFSTYIAYLAWIWPS